ncbi:MAG: FAD-binding oxidoreductase [Acidobacteriota bacterium]
MNEYPYWLDSPGLRRREPFDAHELAPGLPARVDVAIIGAGYTGLAAARQLARAGASVVVLERERVGWGASSRNGGQVLTGLKLDAATLVARFGETGARTLFQTSIDAIAAVEQLVADERLECEYERSGHVDAANKPSHFKAFRGEQVLLQRVFGHRVELVPVAEQRQEIGSAAYHGLMLDQRSGALNPAQYVEQLAAAASRAGAVIVEGAGVTGLSRQQKTWTVTTDRGPLIAGDVLAATNGYTDGSVPWLQRRLVPIGSYIIATEPLTVDCAAALIPKRRMVFDSKYFLHYYRLTRDNRLLFGGRAEFAPPTPETTRRCAEILRRDMAALFPMLESTRVEYAWSGNVAFTRDQLPHAGRLDGAYFAGGYCGHGIAMGTYLGSLIARRMAGELIEHPLINDTFAPIPLYHGTPWFLPLAGAYYAVKDWLQ